MATKKPVDFDELYPGRFMKAGEFGGRDLNFTITNVVIKELEGRKRESKGVLSFRETPKELVLNRTNGECIKAMFGRKVAEWVGKRITLYPARIESEFGDLAVRVRGSPDVAADVTFTLQLARMAPRQVTLKKTASGRAAAARPASAGSASEVASGGPASPPSAVREPAPPEPTDEEQREFEEQTDFSINP
jgi:hypothetical protein